MTRFVLLAAVVLMLTMALFGLAVELFGLEPDASDLARSGVLRIERVPPKVLVSGWALETAGLVALFLLLQGRGGSWWLDGLLTGWIAWIFRGPVLVVAVVTATRLPREPWFTQSLHWLLLYSICGLLLGWLAKRLRIERS